MLMYVAGGALSEIMDTNTMLALVKVFRSALIVQHNQLYRPAQS